MVRLLLPLLVSIPARQPHPLHTTLTTIEWRAESQLLQVAVRVFTQDLSVALARIPRDTACGYARRALELRDASDRELRAVRCAARDSADVTWIRLEALTTAVTGLRVRNSFLFESFGDQVNVVQANLHGRWRTMLFTRGDPPKVIEG